MSSNYLFIFDSGDLFDTKKLMWYENAPLREKYKFTFRNIENTHQFKSTLRAGPYVLPGAYPLYFTTLDGGALCFTCAKVESKNVIHSIRNKIYDGWFVVACDVNYENIDLCCNHCNSVIEAAYND